MGNAALGVAFSESEVGVLFVGRLEMFELDDTDLLELGAQPAIACIEQAELATVRARSC